MTTDKLLTKNAFYESDVFQTIADEAGIPAYLDSEGEIGSRYKDNEGNIRGYTPRQILDSGGSRSNVVQEIKDKRGNTRKIALSNPEFFQFASTLKQVLGDPQRLQQVQDELGVDAAQLQSDYEAVEPVYLKMWSRIKSNNSPSLATSDYEKREQGREPLIPPSIQLTSGLAGYGISQIVEKARGSFFGGNEDQRESLVLRGVNPRYLENSYEEFAPIDKDYYYRSSVSPITPTPQEYKNIIRKFDLDAEVEYINPQAPQEGLIVKSKFNPFDEERGDYAWVPVSNVQPMESAFEGDISPVLRELAKFGSQEGTGIALSGGLLGLVGRQSRKKIQDRLQTKATQIDTGKALPYGVRQTELGKATGEILLTALGAAGIESSTKLAQLALGTTEIGGNVQPDLQLERAIDDSGAMFAAALMYGAGGDAFLRSAGAMWGKLTGRPPSSDVIDAMIVEARILGDKIRRIDKGELPEETTPEMRERILEVVEENRDIVDPKTKEAIQQEDILAGGGATITRDKEFEELTPGEMLKLVQNGSTEAAERIRQQMQSLGQMSDNEQILAFEELMSEIVLDMPIARNLENFHRENSALLEQFYTDILRKTGINPREAQELGITKETLNNVFSGIRSQKLVDDLSEEELALAETMANNRLGNLFPSDVSRQARQEAAETIQERVNVAQSKAFPDEKSRLIIQRSEELDETRSLIGGVLEREQYNDSSATVKLPKYIKKSLEDFLNANKQEGVVFGSEDTAEAAEFIRTILPNRETEGISIQLLLGQGRDESGAFLPQRDFTQKELILTRENLAAAISGHPNRVIREKGQALLDDVDKAIDDNFRQMYKVQTGKKAPENMERVYDEVGREYQILALQLADKQRDLSSRFLINIANKDESEIGSFIRTAGPSQVRSLVEFLSRQEGGLEKLQAIKSTVLESVQRELDVDNVDVGVARSRFNSIMSKNEEQLRALFPEDFVKFENYRDFLGNAKKSITKSQAGIRAINKELEKLSDNTGRYPTLTETLDQYFNLSITGSKNVRETQLGKFVNNLGEMAKDYPELQTALQEYFAENVVLGLRGTKFRGTTRGTKMLDAAGPESTFDIKRLKDLILTPFNTDAEAARFLEPIVGKDEAFRYAKDLRILARMVNKQKGFAGNSLEEYAAKDAKGQIGDLRARGGGRGTIARLRKFVFGPLDLTSTRIGVASDVFKENLNASSAKYLGEIVSDPKKLNAYLRAEQLKLPVLTMYQITAAIASGRESNLGSEENQSAVDRIVDELSNLTDEQNATPERIMRLIEEKF
tara:strand:- start:7 stop:3873 length:3867 start_codon:yes stop_codon:yes gene_type:complete